MIRKEFPDSWHGHALPGGQFAISHLGPDVHVQTHLGRLDGQDLLWTRCYQSPNGFRVAGATHEGDRVVERSGNDWLTKGPAYGMNPVAYNRDGVLLLATPTNGAQGIAWVDESNVPVNGDQVTYDDRVGLHNWVSKSGYVIGQETGDRDWTVVVCPDGTRRLIEDGTCKFIQFEVNGPQFAITIVKEKGGHADKTVVYWGDLTDLNTFPITVRPGTGTPPPPPPDPTDPNDPKDDPMPPVSQIEVVRARLNQFPNPLGERHGDFLILLARDLHALLQQKETSPSAIKLPSGRKVSPDGMIVQGWFVDVLVDAEGNRSASWDPKGPVLPEWTLLDPFREPLGAPPSDPTGPTDPTPIPDLEKALKPILARLKAIEEKQADQEAKLVAATTGFFNLATEVSEVKTELAKPRTYKADVGRAWGHSHSVTVTEVK